MELTEQQKLEILCAYLPHGVGMEADEITKGYRGRLVVFNTTNTFRNGFTIQSALEYNARPILRHPDDMTEEELSQLGRLLWNDKDLNKNIARENAKDWLKCYLTISLRPEWAINCLRYLHSIHIDTFGAIEAGWAIRKESK